MFSLNFLTIMNINNAQVPIIGGYFSFNLLSLGGWCFCGLKIAHIISKSNLLTNQKIQREQIVGLDKQLTPCISCLYFLRAVTAVTRKMTALIVISIVEIEYAQMTVLLWHILVVKGRFVADYSSNHLELHHKFR